ncbi:MAG: hypothetical protein HY735_13475 [Verrucomicrobia bacterium]|nr:hypothetical protein [Verrucomicrobiota bacterium]
MNCTRGVVVNIANDTLTLSQDTYCEVATPVDIFSGTVSGSMTEDCGVVSLAWVNDPAEDRESGDSNKNSQSECSFVLATNNVITTAFFDTHFSEYALGVNRDQFTGISSPRSIGWALSTDGGATFTDKGAMPTNPPANPSYGDAGDPVMARDTTHNVIYLLGNPSREFGFQGFRLWKSTDNGCQKLRSGEKASLSVVASGGVAMSYQWYQGQSGDAANPVLNATNASFTTPPLSANTSFWVKVQTSAGATNSASATVTVRPANSARLNLRLDSGVPKLSIDGAVGTTYRIDYTSDLPATDWIVLTNLPLTSNPLTFTDTTATDFSARFYRVVVP